MARLIDDLRRKDARVAAPVFLAPNRHAEWADYTKRVFDVVRSRDLVVIKIDNVADFYFTASDQEHWDLVRDFPNIAPPYKMFWCEHRLPKLLHSKEKGDTDIRKLCPTGRVGMMFYALDRHEAMGEGIPENVRWCYWADIFIDYDQRGFMAQGPHGAAFFAVDEHGVLVGQPWAQTYNAPGTDDLVRSLMTWYHPGFLAVSFLHCKNVTVVENAEPKPLAKKYHAKHGIAPTGYKTLVIEPLKQILRTEGKSESVGIKRSMHICRGHFKDYREGRGLFGKYKMLVWHPMTTRGTRGKSALAREVEIKV
jgi:hypothetical protein